MSLLSNKPKGFTLVEIIVVIVIVSIFFLAVSNTFYQFSKGLLMTKARILANNLAQEKIELLKNISYHRLLVTRDADLPENPPYDVNYDTRDYDPYQKEGLLVGDITFTRQILIYKVKESDSGNIVHETSPGTIPDTGLKKIIVTVLWQEGSAKKELSITNFCEDPDRLPLSGTIFGVITTTPNVSTGFSPSVPSPNGPLRSARVLVLENPVWETYTDVNGLYELTVSTGQWSIRVSKHGYWDYYTTKMDVKKDPPTPKNVQLTQKLTGIVTGFVCYNDHLVISQVVTSTPSPTGFNQEYVELYNPTTYQIYLGSGSALGGDWKYAMKYAHGPKPTSTLYEIVFDNTDPILGGSGVYIPSYGFCLISNTPTVVIGGNTVLADVLFSQIVAVPGYPDSIVPWHYIEEKEAGGISLWKYRSGGMFAASEYVVGVDSVGWSDSKGTSAAPAEYAYETDYIVGKDGIFPDPGTGVARIGAISLTSPYLDAGNSVGHAFDSDNNAANFLSTTTGSSYAPIPRSTSSPTVIPRGGTPAYGAVITCNDGLSSAVTSYMVGSDGPAYFETEVATGTWTVFISSDNYCMEVSSVIVRYNKYTSICNYYTNPSWPSGLKNYPTTILSSVTTGGYISGQVTCGGTGLNNIRITVGAVDYTTTDSQGNYSIYADSGPCSLTANPLDENNPLYSTVMFTCDVKIGEIVVKNFNLSQGGRIWGWVTTGFDDLPNIPIKITKGGLSHVTDSDNFGEFWFPHVDTGTWTAEPILDLGENSAPSSVTEDLEMGEILFMTTFTITGAYGTICGEVYEGTKKIQTGVLIIATTGPMDTIDLADPDVIDDDLRRGELVYYGTVSQSDGKYKLPVRGGFTYSVFAWYTKVQRNSVTVLTKSESTPTPVDAKEEEELNLKWP